MISLNEVAIVKVSGEKVFVINHITNPLEPDTLHYQTRRAYIKDNGGVDYVNTVYSVHELETLEECFTRMAEEIKLKGEVQERVLNPTIRPAAPVSMN